MTYTIELTVPHTTDENNVVNSHVTVPRGILCNGRIYFSPGVNGVVRCYIMDGSKQLFPRISGERFRLMVPPLEIHDKEPLSASSTNIYLYAYADGASYDHRIRYEFDVIPFDQPELIL